MSNVLIAGSADPYIVGIPQNNACFFDGIYYWVFYQSSGTLSCLYGTSLATLASAGSTGLSGISNSGRMYSVLFGEIAGTPYAWCLYDNGTQTFGRRRWQLTSGGLGTPTDLNGAITSKAPGHATLSKDFGGVNVANVYASVYGDSSNVTPATAANRSADAALTTDTGANSADPANMIFMEHSIFLELSDGYLCFMIDEGNSGETGAGFGHASEWTKTLIGDSWGTEIILDGNVTGATAGSGDFTDQNYATNTSHAGQQDITQLDSGDIYVAYIGDDDTVNANYGQIKLVQRGNTKASTWTLKTNDLIGSNVSAWHLAMTTDGTDIWVFYCKNNAGVRDTAIYYKKYNVSLGSFSSETKLADIQSTYAFSRMFTQYRAANDKIVVSWSEFDGATSYDLVAEEVLTVSSTLTLSITGIPDGTYQTILHSGAIEVFNSTLTYTSGTATTPVLSIAASTLLTGYVVDNNATPIDGAVIVGTTA